MEISEGLLKAFMPEISNEFSSENYENIVYIRICYALPRPRPEKYFQRYKRWVNTIGWLFPMLFGCEGIHG